MNMKTADSSILELGTRKVHFLYHMGQGDMSDRSTVFLSFESPTLRITGLTSSTLKSFVRTISEPIIAGVARANQNEDGSLAKPEKNRVFAPLTSSLSVVTNSLKLELFRYSFKDNDAVGLVMKGISLSVAISHGSASNLLRTLRFRFLPVTLSRVIYEGGKGAQPRDILNLPTILGDLETDQRSRDDTEITYNFVTNFDGWIEPSLNLSDYDMLVGTIKYLVTNLNLSEKKKDPEKKKQKAPGEKRTKYTFLPVNYQLNPRFKVGMGASIKPDVPWLLARLGIADEHIIPASLFEFVCLGVDDFLRAITEALK
jgi:hypothetical protein